mgnify:FL=1
MTAQAQSILREAMKLPPEERADVATELLASLDDADEPQAEVEAAWAAETERRARRVLSGEAVGVSWHEVRERLEDQLKKS